MEARFEKTENKIVFTVEKVVLGTNVSEAVASLTPEKPPIKQLPTDCPIGFLCSDFRDEDFSGWSDYSRSSRNPRSLTISSDSLFDNPHLLFKKDVTGLNFEVQVRALPKNENKGNVVIVYNNVWRCIIGEANYNTLSCQFKYNSKNPPKRRAYYLSKNNHRPISPNNDISIYLISTLTTNNKNKIQLTVKYIDLDGNPDEETFEEEFPVPSVDIADFKESIGVGIIDPKKEKIEVEFKQFKLTKR